MSSRRNGAGLAPSDEEVRVRAFDSFTAWCEAIPPGEPWGFYTTPTKARLLRRRGLEWSELLAWPRLVEARLFAAGCDARWLEDRGIVLELVPPGEARDGEGEEGIGGAGWLQRDRRSRLWGSWLEGSEAWYEERIPDPLFYRGLPPGPENRFPFLRYREYVRRGVVEMVRYLAVEGGSQ